LQEELQLAISRTVSSALKGCMEAELSRFAVETQEPIDDVLLLGPGSARTSGKGCESKPVMHQAKEHTELLKGYMNDMCQAANGDASTAGTDE
jgi:hypothetical protein